MTTAEKIAFQNGLLVGVYQKGVVSADHSYKPIIWNNEGDYTSIYMDFKYTVRKFSLGMLRESIGIVGVNEIRIASFQKLSSRVVRVHLEESISELYAGVYVVGYHNTRLMFSSGDMVPMFYQHFFVTGIPSTRELPYMYDEDVLVRQIEHAPGYEITDTELHDNLNIEGAEHLSCIHSTVTSIIENSDVILIGQGE